MYYDFPGSAAGGCGGGRCLGGGGGGTAPDSAGLPVDPSFGNLVRRIHPSLPQSPKPESPPMRNTTVSYVLRTDGPPSSQHSTAVRTAF